MNPQETTHFLAELQGDVMLNDRQQILIRRALEPLTFNQADRAITNQYRQRDRLSPSALLQELEQVAKADEHGVTRLVHPLECACGGTGWVDSDQVLTLMGREYTDFVEKCDERWQQTGARSVKSV